nr:uncharacterized protein LOC127319739 [Lolium perenne]
MVARSSVLGGGQVSRSEVLGLAPVLPWEAPSVLCYRMAMVAALEFQSPATKYVCVAWIPACSNPVLAQLPLIVRLGPYAPRVASPPVRQRISPHSLVENALGFLDTGGDFELGICEKLMAAAVQHQVQFYAASSFSCHGMSSDLSLGIHERSYIRCGLKPINFLHAAKNCKIITTQPAPRPIRCGVVRLISQVKFYADGNGLEELVQMPACWNQNSSFLLQIVCLHIQKGAAGPVLGFFTRFEDDLHCYGHVLENNEMENHLHHHPGVPPKLKKISSCEYTNLALHQLYMEIFESGSWSIGHAARSLNYFTKNNVSCVNQWSKVAEGNFKGHRSLIVFRRQRGCFVFLKEAEGLINPFGHAANSPRLGGARA